MYAYQLITVFVLAFIGGFVASADDEVSPLKLGKKFKELEVLLIKRINSDDATENMKIVENLIPEAESSTFMGFKNKKDLAKAEKLFLSLTKLEDEKMCNRDGFKISTDNAKAIKKGGSLKRIGAIYEHYVKKQQEVCFPVYTRILNEKLATMDQAKLKRLDYVMQKSMNKDRKGRTDAHGLFSLIKMGLVGPKVGNLYETLQNIPQEFSDDSELKKVTESRDLQRLVASRYLIEPCDEFIVNLAEDMFAPASTWIAYHTVDDNQNEFYYNWARYKFCANAYKAIRG